MDNDDDASGSTSGFASDELQEMHAIFAKHDVDKSGILEEKEFTAALNDMDYQYNQNFVVEVLKLVFEDDYESKHGNLTFDDFLEYMQEFEPVHFQVIDEIENKLKMLPISSNQLNSIDMKSIFNQIEMKDGTLILDKVDAILEPLIQQNNNQTQHDQTNHVMLRQGSTATLTVHEISQHEQQNNLQKSIVSSNTQDTSNQVLAHSSSVPKIIVSEPVEKQSTAVTETLPTESQLAIISEKESKTAPDMSLMTPIQSPNHLQVESKDNSHDSTVVTRRTSDGTSIIEDEDDEQYMQHVWKQILDYFDADHDGTISNVEMAPAMRALGIDVAHDEINQLIDEIDANNSGNIDYAEFRAFYKSLFDKKMKKYHRMLKQFASTLDAETKIDLKNSKLTSDDVKDKPNRKRSSHNNDVTLMKSIFETYDKDQSGYLDYNEFKFAMKKLCPNLDSNTIQDIISIIDINRDEQVEFDEFIQFLASQHKQYVVIYCVCWTKKDCCVN